MSERDGSSVTVNSVTGKLPMGVTAKSTRKWYYLWLILSLAWLGFVGWRTWQHWPAVPLDMTTLDPETRTVFTEALVYYALNAVLVGLGIPFLVYLAGRLLGLFRPR